MEEPRHIQLLKQQFANNPARLAEVLRRERYQDSAGDTYGTTEQKQGRADSAIPVNRFHIVVALLICGLVLKLVVDLLRD